MMAPSELAEQTRRDAERGSAAAQTQLALWHLEGEEGLLQDDVKAAALFREAADLGIVAAQSLLALCNSDGTGLEQNLALAAEWGRKAADQGDRAAQFFVGDMYARGGMGVKKDLPLGKRYLELCAAQGKQEAAALLKELRKCVACGKLDVHHMICAWCRNVRYCDGRCQLRHWHWHKPHCGRRREVAGAGAGAGAASSDTTADNDECAMQGTLELATTAAEAKMEAARAEAAKVEAAKAAVAAARAVAAAAVTKMQATARVAAAANTTVIAARAAADAAPAASKKEKKKKAKLMVKVKAAETAAQAAEMGARSAQTAARAAVMTVTAAVAAVDAATAVLEEARALRQAATAVLEAAVQSAT